MRPTLEDGRLLKTVDGLNRRISCIHRMYNSRCGRRAASGSRQCSAHQVRKQRRFGVLAGGSLEPGQIGGYCQPGERIVRALERTGFKVARVGGSHHIMRHPDGRGTTVPAHPGRDVAKGTPRGILSDVGMSIEERQRLL
jgi:predicted RNA binding protein YcfA (HicA-like mRNA interferase family)